MKQFFQMVVIFGFFFGRFGWGVCSIDCNNPGLSYLAFNAVGWQYDFSETFDSCASELFEVEFEYEYFLYQENITLGSNLISSSDYKNYFDLKNVGAVMTHGNPMYIAVEYAPPTSLGVMQLTNSAMGQDGLWDWGNDTFLDCALAPVISPEGQVAWALVVLENYYDGEIALDYDFSLFFNACCYGAENVTPYCGWNDPEKCFFIGPDCSYTATLIDDQFFELFEQLKCSYGLELNSWFQAFESLRASQNGYNIFDYYGNSNLTPHPCRGCKRDSGCEGESVFANIGFNNEEFFWYLHGDISCTSFKVSGLRDGCVFETQTVPYDREKQHWAGKFYCEFIENAESFFVEAINGEFPISVSQETPLVPSAIYASEDDKRLLSIPKFVNNIGATSSDNVLIAYQTDGGSVFNISPLIGYYQEQGLSVGVITDPDNFMEGIDIQQKYSDLMDLGVRPLLVLLGARPYCNDESYCPYGIPAMTIVDDCNCCNRGGVCYSDYLMTDINFDNIPDGPVTRIPVGSQGDLESWIDHARQFGLQTNIAPFRQIGFVCGDGTNGVYYDELLEVSQQYQNMGYIPKFILKESDYPSPNSFNQEGWDDFGSQLEGGLLEIWIRGAETGFDQYTNVLCDSWLCDGGFFDGQSWINSIGRNQGFIVWAPSCVTEFFQCAPNVWGGIPSLLFSGVNSHAVALVGHCNSGWQPHHSIMREFLMEERVSAIPGVTKVSEIAFNAVKNFMVQYPHLKAHALGTTVIGCDVSIQFPEFSDVPVGPNSLAGISVVYKYGFPGVHFESDMQSDVSLYVYDVRGREICTLVEAKQFRGGDSIWWDGLSDSNYPVANGTYLFVIRCGDLSKSIKVVFIN